MNLKLKWRNIRLPFKLLLFYTPLIIIPAVIGLYFITQSYTESSKKLTEEYASDLIALMVQKMDDQLLEYEQLSKQIMINDELHSLISQKPTSAFDQLNLERAINNQLNVLWLGDEQNKYIKSIKISTNEHIFTYGDDDVTGYNVNQQEYKDRVKLQKGGALWFAPESYTDGYKTFEAFRLARVIRDKKLNQLGFLTIVIDSESIVSIFDQTKFKEDVSLRLLNAEGELILGNQHSIADDQDHILSFSEESMHNGWRLSAKLSLEPLFKPIRDMTQLSMIIIGICTLLGLLVTHIIAVDIVIPIRKLMVNMKHGIKGVNPGELKRFRGGIEIVEMNDTFISVMYEIEQLIKQVVKNEKLKQKAEISVLQKQLSPHFLVNTLNSIRWMAMIQRQDNIKEMVEALNGLLTYSIRGTGDPIALEEELTALKDYVKIQKIRYQDFEMITDIEPGTEKNQILKLLIQPLIENALLHGLTRTDKPGEIVLRAREVEDQMKIQVIDNGVGMDQDFLSEARENMYHASVNGEGIGLSSIHERIQLHFGNAYGVEINSEEGKGTVVVLTLPLNRSKD